MSHRGVLSDLQIMHALDDGTVVIDPFERIFLQPNSYDLHLANVFYVSGYVGHDPVFYGPFYARDGEPVTLFQGTTLGYTKEIIGTTPTSRTVVKIFTPSSLERCCIDVCKSAGVGDIGYINPYTLELTGHVGLFSDPPVVFAGQKIAQVVFFASGDCGQPYCGQYAEHDWPLNMIPKKYRTGVISPHQLPRVYWPTSRTSP